MKSSFFRRMADRLGWLPLVAWVAAYFAARIGLERTDLAPWARVALAVLPIAPFALMILVIIAYIRRLDELHIRVHLEALAVAFPLTLLLLMTLALFELATGLNPDDWSYRHVWPIIPVFYFGGLALAWRRYR